MSFCCTVADGDDLLTQLWWGVWEELGEQVSSMTSKFPNPGVSLQFISNANSSASFSL
jgi:hypothetical protein